MKYLMNSLFITATVMESTLLYKQTTRDLHFW